MTSSFIDDLAARLDALEEYRLKVADLPLAALQRKLEADWQPDAGLLLGQGLPRGGLGTLTFTASTLSATLTVAHGLGRPPTAVVATSVSAPAVDQIVLCNTGTWNPTSFNINAEVDAAITNTIQFAWIAL